MLLLAGMASTTAIAQSYYDDDIYYDASKDTKKEAKANKKVSGANKEAEYQQAGSQYRYITTTDGTVYVVDDAGNAYPTVAQNIPGSDLYTVYTDNTRDVDEYNRRYQIADTVSVDSLYREDTFANTRNIERFSNPDIVSQSNDEALIEYYAATQPAQINIYMDTPAYYGWGYASPYYSPYRYWSSWAWDPWYYGPGWYDPYYSWSWGWGPAWGWGWSWGCGHDYWHHHHDYYPGHGHYQPISPGAHRPSYPGSSWASNGGYRGNSTVRNGGASGGYRGSAGSNRGSASNVGSVANNSGTRTGGYRGSRPSTVGNVSSLGSTRPATNYRGNSGSSGTRNSGVSGSNRSGGRSGSTYNSNSNSSRSNSSTYRSSGSSGGSRSGYNGGGRSGGGGSRSGGGGGRGGRR